MPGLPDDEAAARGRPAGRPPRHTLRFKLAASAAVFATSAALVEIGARSCAPEGPRWQAGENAMWFVGGHPTRLWGLAPGVHGAAGALATTNERGYRGPVARVPKEEGARRIVLVGDSSVFGHGVPDDQTLACHLAGALAGLGLPVEVVNLGVPGYSTEQTRILLDEVGWAMEPDLVVVGNLWSDCSQAYWRDEDLLRTNRVLNHWIIGRSAVFRSLAAWVDRLRGGRGAHIVTWVKDSTLPANGPRRVPVHRYAANLDAIARDAAAHGAGTAFLVLTHSDALVRDIPASCDLYAEAMRMVARHDGLVVVETKDALAAAAAGWGVDALYADTLHPSGVGHSVIAGATARALLAAGWPRRNALRAAGGPLPELPREDPWEGRMEPAPRELQGVLFPTGGGHGR